MHFYGKAVPRLRFAENVSSSNFRKYVGFVHFFNNYFKYYKCFLISESKTGKALNEKWQKETNSDFRFMRRGIVGSHREELSQEQCDRIDAWSDKCMKDNGICKNYDELLYYSHK